MLLGVHLRCCSPASSIAHPLLLRTILRFSMHRCRNYHQDQSLPSCSGPLSVHCSPRVFAHELVVHRRKQACSRPAPVDAATQSFAQEKAAVDAGRLAPDPSRRRYSVGVRSRNSWSIDASKPAPDQFLSTLLTNVSLRKILHQRHPSCSSLFSVNATPRGVCSGSSWSDDTSTLAPDPLPATLLPRVLLTKVVVLLLVGVVVVTVVLSLLLPHFLRLLLRLLPFLLCMHGGTPAASQALSLRLHQVDSRALTGRSRPDTRRTRTTTANSTPLFPLSKVGGRRHWR